MEDYFAAEMRLFDTSNESASEPVNPEQLTMIKAILIVLIIAYALLFCFIGFNFWRILILQKKFMLIPLTIFYVSSFIIVVTRIVDNVYFLKFYANGQDSQGSDY